MTLILRDYQETSVAALQRRYGESARRILFVMATGGGKTAIFLHIAQSRLKKGKRTIIFVHRDNLLKQISRDLTKLGLEHGVIAPKFVYEGQPLAVASLQSFASRVAKANEEARAELLNFDFWVVDEAHHSVSRTYRETLDMFKDARGLGVTATPQRTDGSGLGEVYDAIVIGPATGWLIEQGYLVEPVVYAPPVQFDMKGVRKIAGDYSPTAQTERVNKPTITGDAISHYRKLASGEPAIYFCCSIRHAEDVSKAFCEAGYRALAVSSNNGTEAQQDALAALADGRLQVLTTCDLIGEGTDIPRVTVVGMLRRTTSLINYLQWIGRALRPVYASGHDLSTPQGRLAAIASSDKPNAIVIDHVGNFDVHGAAEDERDWSLNGHAKKKKKASETAEINVIQCKGATGCYAWYRQAPKCPHCGNEAPTKPRVITVTEGELVKITKEQKEAAKKAARVEQGRARTPEELIRLAVKRKLNKPVGYVAHILKSRGQFVSYSELSRIHSTIIMEA